MALDFISFELKARISSGQIGRGFFFGPSFSHFIFFSRTTNPISTTLDKQYLRLESIRICSYERPFRTETKNNDHIISLKTLKQSAQTCDYPGNSLNTGQLQKRLLVSVLVKYMYISDVRIQGMLRKPDSQMTRSEEDVPRVCFPSLVPGFISLASTFTSSSTEL